MPDRRHRVKRMWPDGRWSLLVPLLVGMGSLCSPVMAQRPFDPLASSEIELARAILLSDARVKASLGETARYRIVNVERHEEAKAVAVTAPRRADVVLYNYTKDQTISAVVRLAGNPQVDDLTITTEYPPALSPEELEEARQLALADPAVQAKLQLAGVSDTGADSLIVTHLYGRAIDGQDACFTHRCIALFFNTKEALLFTATVDLSAQRVQVQ